MAIEILKETYNGRIIEEEIGIGSISGLTIGGQNAFAFHLFEGEIPNPPRIALEVYDEPPTEWAKTCFEPWADVAHSPVEWAKKAVEIYGAEIICLKLQSTNPNGSNRNPEDAAIVAKQVAEAVNVPVIIFGCESVEKDAVVLKKVAEVCEGMDVIIGPLNSENYKTIGAAAIGYKQWVIAQSPNDVNLAKQLNILLENLGVSPNKIIMDTTTGSLGYGIEYTYTIAERIRLAALTQNDTKVQMPIINNVGPECWKVKEAKEDIPGLGDTSKRGILWEAITAYSLALAGSDMLIMRHPQAANLVKKMISQLRG